MSKATEDQNKAVNFLGQIDTKFNDFLAQEQDNPANPILKDVHAVIKSAKERIQNGGEVTPQPKLEDLPEGPASRNPPSDQLLGSHFVGPEPKI